VVTLSGSVPSRDVSQRAEDRARSVLGVADVRNEILLSTEDIDPILAFQRADSPWFQKRLPKPQPRLNDPGFSAPVDLARNEQTVKLFWQPATGERSNTNPIPAGSQEDRHQFTGMTAPAVPYASRANNSQAGLPAVAIGQPGSTTPEKPRALLSSRSPEDDLFRSIELLRQSKPAFSAIRYRVLDGVVYLSDDSNHGAAKFQFAQAVSLLPGVRKVILEDQPK
jgi:hypothetical protein